MRLRTRRLVSLRQFCGAGVATTATLALCLPATAAAAPNVCRITGMTHAVGKQVFPELSGIGASQTEEQTTPPNLGICSIAAKNIESGLNVELWPAADFETQAPKFDYHASKEGKTVRLHSLGKGAYYSWVTGNINEANVLFGRGKYTVVITPTRIGGTPNLYPTKKQYLLLAHAIYEHLR
jgi:hypothetical protein